MDNTLIIGIDCAVDPKKVGVAAARVFADHPDQLILEAAVLCSKDHPPVDVVRDLVPEDGSALLAFDSPLGWPEPLARELISHWAGEPISTVADALFRRHTDRFIKERTRQQSLDVGADRIARTARAALAVLGGLRQELDEEIPLAWTTNLQSRIAAIEVYPAATLKVRGIENKGYKDKKKAEHRKKRELILDALDLELDAGKHRETLLDKADVLDAALCTVAGLDFLRRRCWEPTDLEAAQKEGWIWVRRNDL